MPRFLAVHTLPDLTEEGLLSALSEGKPEYPSGVDWKLTYCALAESKFYCEWDAPDVATLKGVFKEQKTPYEAIYAVKLLDWNTRTLE